MNSYAAEKAAENIRKRYEGSDKEFLFGAERIDIRYLSDFKFEVKKKDLTFLVDEPSDRGGSDSGPNPLAAFLAGCATCLGMQYVRLFAVDKFPFETFAVAAVAHFDRRVKGSFTEIIYDVRIDLNGQEDGNARDRTSKIAKQAEELCYVHNTLTKAGVRIQTNIFLNGNKI